MRQPWNGGRTQQVHTRGVRVINPNVTVGPSTSAASILNEGLHKAGRRRGQVIAATGSNGAVANPLCSATIHTLLPGARGRPNPSPDQTSARPSVGACSRQTTSGRSAGPLAVRDRNVVLRQESRLRKPGRGCSRTSPLAGTGWPPSPPSGAGPAKLRGGTRAAIVVSSSEPIASLLFRTAWN